MEDFGAPCSKSMHKQGPYSIMGQGSSWLWLFRQVEELTIMQRSLPSWVVFWLFVTGVVCTIDALFIILRPHTLPDGKWNYLVKPCESNEQSQDWARFPYNNPLNLLCMQQFHTLSLLFLTNSLIWIESKHVCIINVWAIRKSYL